MTKKIDEMPLVVRIEGGIQETNLLEFEAEAQKIIKSFNLDPKTDEEYVVAEANAKDCKEFEDRIETVRKTALAEIQDVHALFETMNTLSEDFRQARLTMAGKVNKEKVRRKDNVINTGITQISEAIRKSKVNHADFGDYAGEVRAAAKGKKKIESIEDAVRTVTGNWFDKIQETEETFNELFDIISKETKDYDGLFPDIYNLALKPEAEVRVTIDARIEKFNLREELKKKEKEALERVETQPDPAPTFDDFPAFNDFPTPGAPLKEYTITISLKRKESEVQDFIHMLKRQGVIIISVD